MFVTVSVCIYFPPFISINFLQKYEALEQNVCLVRDYKAGLLLLEENNNQRKPNTNRAQVKQNLLTTLGTESMALARPSYGDSGSGTKTKKSSTVDRAATQEVRWVIVLLGECVVG